MAKQIVTEPVREPVTLEEAKDWMRITQDDQDAMISEIIVGARRYVEAAVRRALITQTWDFTLDRFPGWRGTIELPRPPLQSVTSLSYVDAQGASKTLDAGKYQVDAVKQPARLMPVFGETWPDTYEQMNAVTVRFVAGYGDNTGDVPATIRNAILMLCGHLYENPDASSAGVVVTTVPMGLDFMLGPFRVHKTVD